MPKKRGKTSLKKRRSFQWIPTRKNKANVAPGAEVFDGESKEIPALAADDKEEGGENPGVVAASEGEKTPRAAASEGENAPSRRGGAWRTFAISVRGATHIKNDKPKQDAAGSRDPETISEDDGERRFAWRSSRTDTAGTIISEATGALDLRSRRPRPVFAIFCATRRRTFAKRRQGATTRCGG